MARSLLLLRVNLGLEHLTIWGDKSAAADRLAIFPLGLMNVAVLQQHRALPVLAKQ